MFTKKKILIITLALFALFCFSGCVTDNSTVKPTPRVERTPEEICQYDLESIFTEEDLEELKREFLPENYKESFSYHIAYNKTDNYAVREFFFSLEKSFLTSKEDNLLTYDGKPIKVKKVTEKDYSSGRTTDYVVLARRQSNFEIYKTAFDRTELEGYLFLTDKNEHYMNHDFGGCLIIIKKPQAEDKHWLANEINYHRIVEISIIGNSLNDQPVDFKPYLDFLEDLRVLKIEADGVWY